MQYSRSDITNNLFGSLYFLSGAIISFYISGSNQYPSYFWIPLGIAVGYIHLKGDKMFPGIILASILSQYFLGSQVELQTASQAAKILMPIILSSAEISSIYILYKAINGWNLISPLDDRVGSPIHFLIIAILVSIPLSIIQVWAYSFTYLNYTISSTFSFVLGNTLVITLITPFIISIKPKVFKLSPKIVVPKLIITISFLLAIAIGFSPLLIHTLGLGPDLFYIILFVFSVYLSLKFRLNFYGFFITLISILSIALIANLPQGLEPNIYAHQFLVLLIVSNLAHYISDKIPSDQLNNEAIKSSYFLLEEEIDRQTKEYRDLNNELFKEIEKRGIAERELAHSRSLLAEAQEYSGIATWEYLLIEKRFNWLTYNPNAPILDFNIEDESLKSFASKLHPDDLQTLKILKKSILKQNRDFEVEVRLKNMNANYNYYLLRGRAVVEDNEITRVLGLIMDINERKKSEQILIEKEQKYRALFDSNIDSVCVIDAYTLEVVDVNKSFESVYGYTKDEICGKSFLTLSAQPEETKTAIAFGRNKGYYRVFHRTHKRKSGELFFIEANFMSHLVNNREMLFIITHDITNRKKAENSLMEREQKFRTFFESDLIGMAEIGISKEFLNFNNKLSDILGYSREELKLLNWEIITHIDDLKTENRLFNQLLTHNTEGYTLEKRFISKNGSIVDCDVSFKTVKNLLGNISHFIVLISDISARKRAEAEIQNSRAKLSQAQAVAKLGSIMFYPNKDKISLTNEAYEILGFGNSRPALTRKDFFKIILPGPKTRFEEHLCSLENGTSVEGDHEQAIINAKGEVRYILMNYGITLNSSNQLGEVLVTLADITRIKKAEMALQEANILKDQLFSIIGHDLKAPIGAMNQLIELYDQNWKEYDEVTSKSIIENLKTSSLETYKLLENLLEWANSQRSDSYRPVMVDLVPIIEQVISLNKSVANAKNILLQSNLLPNASVMVDVDMIKTVLRNLISNSIKFTPNSGFINVEIEESDNEYQISVIDSGVGIPTEKQAKLFDNNSSFSTKGTNNEKGTGLGLKLVKKFVEKNGGEISLESLPGQGSRFTFKLPKVSYTESLLKKDN